MYEIEFYDREKEIREIRAILDTRPTLITFIYGPINSGKTELITRVIEELPREYIVFYINLRGRFISGYKDFLRALFKLEREKEYKEILKRISEVSLKSLRFTGIPITEGILDLFFREKKYEDVFEFLEEYFMRISANKVPVLIVDELQKIGDVRVNTYLIYELFNFFIRLTKELHLAHVFAITSDSLFIERIYSDAMLHERCRYLLVDDFDYETSIKFLDKYGFSAYEKEVAWNCCGGKPVSLVELVNCEDREERARGMFVFRTGEIETRLKLVKELGDEITIGSRRCEVHYDKLVEVLNMFVSRDEIGMNEVDEVSKRYLVRENILFVDPLRKLMKPQSRTTLLAIREVVKNLSKLSEVRRGSDST